MRIAFAGTPEFAVPPLAALQSSRHQLVGVLTQPDRPAGRGRKLATSAVKEFAMAHGVTVAQPATLRTAEGRSALASWQPDALVVVGGPHVQRAEDFLLDEAIDRFRTAIALPILIWTIKFGWPKIRNYFDRGLQNLENNTNNATNGNN